jgi:hypothetical protein
VELATPPICSTTNSIEWPTTKGARPTDRAILAGWPGASIRQAAVEDSGQTVVIDKREHVSSL